MTRKRLGVLALLVSTVVVFALPALSAGKAVDLREARDALVQAGQQVRNGLKTTVDKTGKKTQAAIEKTKRSTKQKLQTAKTRAAKTRATATDPLRQPPLHGANPHGQGNVAIVDLDPSNQRPLSSDPSGRNSGEEAIVGRARGEKDANGNFHGHITIAALFGNELLSTDSTPGQTQHGPLQGLQDALLDPLCQGTSQNICLSLLTADSKTTSAGSANDFAVARASLLGLNVGAAESAGTILEDGKCQESAGAARTVNVTTSGGTIAGVANSSSRSKSCTGQAPQVTNSSQVINLGGNGVGIPAAGCANGTPDTVGGIPGLLPIVCNAEEIAGAAAVREALDVFALQTGTNSLLKETTAASESFSVAPPEKGKQCNDGQDNDGDKKIDGSDPGCHTDGKPNNPSSYDTNDDDETDSKTGGSGGGGGKGGGGGGGGNQGSGAGGGGNNGAGNQGSGTGAQCADGVDNDDDGVTDEDDPGCHSDGNAGNAGSYNASDTSEGGGAQNLNAGALPFTGTDVIGVALAGLLMLAGGLMLRRREDVRTVR
jgi:hypothetical protein